MKKSPAQPQSMAAMTTGEGLFAMAQYSRQMSGISRSFVPYLSFCLPSPQAAKCVAEAAAAATVSAITMSDLPNFIRFHHIRCTQQCKENINKIKN